MTVPIFHVDAFADSPFTGNPAAVCLLDGPRDTAWMQSVAMEMNLSETAFVEPAEDGFGLRWFTPAVEVDLCGHATLATAHVLWESGRLAASQQARFHTRSGLLTAVRNGDAVELDFPSEPSAPAEPPAALVEGLGVPVRYAGRNRMDWIVETGSEEAVRRMRPDFRLLAKVPTRGIVVTAKASRPGFDFVSRAFFPLLGIDEDPVCGSAHCCLGPYWSGKLGRDRLTALQVSKRTGVVRVTVAGERIKLGGRAVTTVRGELMV